MSERPKSYDVLDSGHRVPTYLSPTSCGLFFTDLEEFYMQKISPFAPPRFKQTQPMSVGSAFDAYVKAYLAGIYAKGNKDYDLDYLITTQVEDEANHAWAREQGEWIFSNYKSSGALTSLLQDLGQGYDVKMEITVTGCVDVPAGGPCVQLLGKPDMCCMLKAKGEDIDDMLFGTPKMFILDWKVNGYCSRSATSPKPGYVNIRSVDDYRGLNKPHKNVELNIFHGITYSDNYYLEDIDTQWAAQVCTYSWLLGAKVGEKILCGIDQICCKPIPSGRPSLRVATYRAFISEAFQMELISKYATVWDVLTDVRQGNMDYFKQYFNPEDLDNRAKEMAKLKDGTTNEQWLLGVMGR